ncbi:hypothetical protein [Clostridium grantii]|uniref:Uncharacterized protein n=1 Tax=Clostridium grantii DSM 8605 TaxID=1121316 RepID=A0A1M5Y316_9CLOT|nr:hypothetical protein [Clostridium grantii]SHI06198.1 hypothetical protein SAMN02745207_04137 [Clostridium grantii DSM 8605]
MTKKALKLLLSIQAKSTCIFIGIYALIMAILFSVFSYVNMYPSYWMADSIIYTFNIYLLIMGIVYPLIATRLYVSRGLTRKQFFWAYTGTMSIISLFLFVPILISIIYYDSFSILSAITDYLRMPLSFLIGWTCAVGFQMRKWYTSTLGILSAIAMYFALITVTEVMILPEIAVLGSVLLLLVGVLLILPRFISKITFKV